MNSPENHQFGFLVRDLARLFGKRFDQRVRCLGVTLVQCRALGCLVRNGAMNQAALAELMEVEPITLTRLLDRMEEAGWIGRRPDPSDRRARLLHVTDKASSILTEMAAIAAEVQREAFAGVSPEQQAMLHELMRKVHLNLSIRQPASTETHRGAEPAGSAQPATAEFVR